MPSAGDYAAPRGERALAYLDAHLSARPFLELGRPTLADVSVFPFVAVAPGAGLPILEYEHIQTWLGRLAALPGFIAMPLVSRGR
ncbi:glutathione S-transferase C-terminal domain-containing protein [Sphingomonas gellani]|uniref:glutathione S-transferase C-terminal domain-containing protein n=1 Tax=Sphingomonas gellani TaxID=1166340 RepID=UPI003CC7AA20